MEFVSKNNNRKGIIDMLTAVTGINWGDEGKGRVIDLLAEQADVVARYQYIRSFSLG